MSKFTLPTKKNKISFKRYPIVFLSLFLIALLVVLYFTNRFLYAPKILLLCMIILIAVLFGKLKIFMKDWFIFLAFLYLSDSLRGFIYFLICKLNLPVYTLYVIKIETFLFGNIPSIVLQNSLLQGKDYAHFTWLEKSLTMLHGTHFIAFLFIGMIIWIQKSNYFQSYKTSFYFLVPLGLLGYLIIPTAPPWIAANLFKIIPEITRFNLELFNMFIPDLTTGFNTNPIAAMPSLHAAFPALCSLILWKLYRWRASFFYVYTMLIFFTIVYTGDHYAADIVAGLFLALLCYYLSFKMIKPSYLLEKKPAHSPEKIHMLKKNMHIIIGALVLALGISIGYSTKNELQDTFNMENIHIPKYIDFFKHQEDYSNTYDVQMYFGSHYLAKGKIDKALFHLKKALDLSKNFSEKKKAEMKIKQCQILREQKKRS